MFVITLRSEARAERADVEDPPADRLEAAAGAPSTTAASPPTITVISPLAARWTPPVTGASSVATPVPRRERREPQQLVPVVRAHVDPGAPGAQPVEDAASPVDDLRDGCGRRQAGDHAVGACAQPRRRCRPTAAPGVEQRLRRRSSRSCTVSGEARAEQAAPRGAGRGCRPRRSRLSRKPSGLRRRREVQLVAVVGMRGGDLLVQLDAETRLGRRDHVAVLPARSAAAGSRRGSRPSRGSPRGSGSWGCTPRAGCWPRPTTGPQ